MDRQHGQADRAGDRRQRRPDREPLAVDLVGQLPGREREQDHGQRPDQPDPHQRPGRVVLPRADGHLPLHGRRLHLLAELAAASSRARTGGRPAPAAPGTGRGRPTPTRPAFRTPTASASRPTSASGRSTGWRCPAASIKLRGRPVRSWAAGLYGRDGTECERRTSDVQRRTPKKAGKEGRLGWASARPTCTANPCSFFDGRRSSAPLCPLPPPLRRPYHAAHRQERRHGGPPDRPVPRRPRPATGPRVAGRQRHRRVRLLDAPGPEHPQVPRPARGRDEPAGPPHGAPLPGRGAGRLRRLVDPAGVQRVPRHDPPPRRPVAPGVRGRSVPPLGLPGARLDAGEDAAADPRREHGRADLHAPGRRRPSRRAAPAAHVRPPRHPRPDLPVERPADRRRPRDRQPPHPAHRPDARGVLRP